MREFTYKFNYTNYSEDLSLLGKKVKDKRPKEYRLCSCGKHVKIVSAHSLGEVSSCQICNQEKHIEELKSHGMEVLDRLDHAKYVVKLPCGHVKTSGLTTLIDSKHYCKTCADNAIINKFNSMGVEVLKLGVKNTLIRFKCGHETTRKTYTKDIPVCSVCEESNKIGFLNQYSITQIEPTKYKLSCGHIVTTQNYKRLGSYKCPQCHEESVKSKVESLGMIYTGNKNSKHEREIILPCGHIKFLRHNCINDRVVCAVCEDTHYAKPCDLYVLIGHSDGLSFIKVGVAGVLNHRIKEYRANKVNAWFNLSNIGFPDKYTAIKYEKEFHLKFKDKRIQPSEMKKHMKEGFTECYPINIMQEILDHFKPLLEQYGGSNRFKDE